MQVSLREIKYPEPITVSSFTEEAKKKKKVLWGLGWGHRPWKRARLGRKEDEVHR